ncbi:MAG: LysR family transcriptional regulator [Candidatus Thiodiazotropha sp.]|jgi:DNA-binding transcriptional LysR family regulator
MNSIRLDILPALVLFARIVQFGSLSGAADRSGLSRSAVSKQLRALEDKLGIRLLQRSTRSVKLTEAGKQVLSQATSIQEAFERVESITDELQGQVTGHLKVSCSSGIGRVHLLPLVRHFCTLFPKVHVQLLLEDRLVDLINEEIDVAIRVGHLPDSSLIALRLGEMNWVVCASPDYLSKNGMPKAPTDLLQHNCLYYQNSQSKYCNWLFMGENGEEEVSISGSLSINDSTALVQAAEAGQGIVWIDRNSLGDALETGRLVQILQDYSLGLGYPIYALYPARHYLPEKTRKFLDFLSEFFSPSIQ